MILYGYHILAFVLNSMNKLEKSFALKSAFKSTSSLMSGAVLKAHSQADLDWRVEEVEDCA